MSGSPESSTLTAFDKATRALETAKYELESTVQSRKIAALRHSLPNAKGFSWKFDEDAWANEQLLLPGTVYLNVDNSRHKLGELSDLEEPDSSALDAIRPHVRDGLTDEEIATVLSWVVDLLHRFDGDRETRAWEFEPIETMRTWDLGLPDLASLFGGWSSPTLPFEPAPAKPKKETKKKAPKA